MGQRGGNLANVSHVGSDRPTTITSGLSGFVLWLGILAWKKGTGLTDSRAGIGVRNSMKCIGVFSTHRIHGVGIFIYMNGWFLWFSFYGVHLGNIYQSHGSLRIYMFFPAGFQAVGLPNSFSWWWKKDPKRFGVTRYSNLKVDGTACLQNGLQGPFFSNLAFGICAINFGP